MKYKITNILFLVCGMALLASCYDDQGGNDFDSVMADVEIVIPQSAYSASLGETITVTPQIKTDIAANDLEYCWEVKGERYNSQGRGFFASLVDSVEQTETLRYVCKLDSNITQLNTSYECRLRVRQKSTGRDFYPADNFTITIEGVTGLMLLYESGDGCDVGILEADEFMPAASSVPDSPITVPALFSTSNDGKTFGGEGVSILQVLGDYVTSSAYDRMRILVRTEEETYWLDRTDLSIYGDWNAAFYLQGDRKVNDGDPKGYVMQSSWGVAFDGDDVFFSQPAYVAQYLFPTYTPETDCLGNTFTFQPYFVKVQSGSGIQYMLYASFVNGDASHCGFVGLTNVNTDDIGQYTKLLDTGDDMVAFNPGDMKAELMQMYTDSRVHVVAVLKGKADHPEYAGKYFFVDINPTASSSGESTYAEVPQCICDMSTFTDINAAESFEFGSTINMCYYATKKAVYRYALDGKSLVAPQPIVMTDGSAINFQGEITMMKMLRSPNVSRHDDDEILLVATYDGTRSALYALHLDNMTGNVLKRVVYDKDTVEDWEFGKIYDVNIKSL